MWLCLSLVLTITIQYNYNASDKWNSPMQSPDWYCSIVVLWCIVCFSFIFHWISLCLMLHVGWTVGSIQYLHVITFIWYWNIFGCLGYYEFIWGWYIRINQPINNWFFVITLYKYNVQCVRITFGDRHNKSTGYAVWHLAVRKSWEWWPSSKLVEFIQCCVDLVWDWKHIPIRLSLNKP